MTDIDPQDVRDFLADVRMQSHRADMAEVIGWLVVCTDLESGSLHISGTYGTPEDALIAAEQNHQSVNRDLQVGEEGWRHTVHPLFPKD